MLHNCRRYKYIPLCILYIKHVQHTDTKPLSGKIGQTAREQRLQHLKQQTHTSATEGRLHHCHTPLCNELEAVCIYLNCLKTERINTYYGGMSYLSSVYISGSNHFI
jgi:hypothetical protein